MASNYEKMADQARALFLSYDQDEMIRRWGLEHDADALYVPFFTDRLRVDRRTARIAVERSPIGYAPKDFVNETMVIFDLLTLAPERPHACGRWASVSMLGGIIGAGHDRTLSHEDTAARFSSKVDQLCQACERLGGVSAGRADACFAVPVFEDFKILFQFWDGDDEFPASIKYLFDENALQYMHYETLWYAMGCLAARLEYLVGRSQIR